MALSETQSNNKLVKYPRRLHCRVVARKSVQPVPGRRHDLHHPRLQRPEGRWRGTEHSDAVEGTRDRRRLRHADRQRGIPRRLRDARPRRLGSPRHRDEEEREAQAVRRCLRRSQAAPQRLGGRTAPRRDDRGDAVAPLESAQANLGSDAGDRVAGIRYEAATATQRNTWNADNSDRVLYGNATANYNATHATALANVDATNDLFGLGSAKLMQRIAANADPAIKPYKSTGVNREYHVFFHGSNTFYDFVSALDAAGIDKDARAREAGGMDKNPLFQGGDEAYRGGIHVHVPEIDQYITNTATSLLTAGAGSIRVNPVFCCGQSALAFAVGQMPKPTFRESTDYQFVEGAGIEMCYVIAKAFKKYPKNATTLKQIGMVTGFFAATGT